jgi:hypothetical protein
MRFAIAARVFLCAFFKWDYLCQGVDKELGRLLISPLIEIIPEISLIILISFWNSRWSWSNSRGKEIRNIIHIYFDDSGSSAFVNYFSQFV